MEVRSTKHSKYNINYHIVWIPKYRHPALTGEVASHLSDILNIIAETKGVEILNLEIVSDHIHLFVSSPPQNAPSLIVNWFKGISARMYNYWYEEPRIKWTNSYYVGTEGTVTAETIKKYVGEQKSK